MRQRDPAATPRELPAFDADEIWEHRLGVGKMWRSRLRHVPRHTAHGVAELRHCVDSNVEKLTYQGSVGMHDNLFGHVWSRQRIKVGAWIHRQLASIGIRHAILDQEAIDVSLLVTANCAGNPIISIAHRKKPVELSFTLQINTPILLDCLFKFIYQLFTVMPNTVVVDIHH